MAANEFAAIYWMEKGYDKGLVDLHALVKTVRKKLPEPELPVVAGKPISEVQYFNNYYWKIVEMMAKDSLKAFIYDYYQFRMLDEILSKGKNYH